ncbi:MAG TPA: lysylphosphatidylglycerol synthase domain-containing protein, partial [Steroidobacteraceae bacterium]|nr:lysylphosphatidylglycerol synthase domain-containing protein [Steroidobacteraceae bacterium]
MEEQLLQGKGRGRAHWLPWLTGLAALVAVVLVATHAAEERAFLGLLQQAQPAWLLLALALQAGTYFAQAEVWCVVLHRAGGSLPFGFACRLSFAKLFMDQAAPSMGLSSAAIVTHALENRGIERATVISSVAVDTASFYIAYLLNLVLALVLVVAAGHGRPLVLTVTALFLAYAATLSAAVLMLSGHTPSRMTARLGALPGVGRLVGVLREASPRLAREPRLLMAATGLQMLIAVLDAATLWAALRALGTPASPTTVFASFMLASVLRSFGLVPAGLGTFEAGSVGALAWLGVPVAAALSATLLFRGLSFWLPMVPGIVVSRRLSGSTAHRVITPVRASTLAWFRGWLRGDAAPGAAAGPHGQVPEPLLRCAVAPAAAVLASLECADDGLTEPQVQRRRAAAGPNVVAQGARRSIPRELLERFLNPLNFLLLLLALISLLIGDRQSAAIIAVM